MEEIKVFVPVDLKVKTNWLNGAITNREGNIILLGPHAGNPEITDREPDIEEKEMYYEEQIVNGRLCWRGLPDEEWKPFTKAELTTKLLETQATLIKLATAEGG